MMELDDEQLGYLREGIVIRERYYGSTDINSDDAYCLTLALAWFREYWSDRLNRKDAAHR